MSYSDIGHTELLNSGFQTGHNTSIKLSKDNNKLGKSFSHMPPKNTPKRLQNKSHTISMNMRREVENGGALSPMDNITANDYY